MVELLERTSDSVKHKTLWRYGGFLFSVGGARVAGILISSLTFPYLVRHLGVQIYGLWSYVVAICAFVGIVADFGLTTYTTQQLAARRELAFEIIPDFLALRFLSAVIAGGVLLLIAFFEVRRDVRQLLCLYGIGLLLVNLISSNSFLQALEMFHARSLLTVAQQALYALAIITFVRGPADVAWVPIAILVSSAISGIAGWTLMWRRGFRVRFILRPERWKAILVPGAHYALASLMSNVYQKTGHLLVRWFLGDYALGLYSAAVRLVDLLRGFVIMILHVLMPRLALAARSEAALNRLARIAFGVVAVISIPMTAGLISAAHLVVPWILGAQYLDDISLLKWMAPYLIGASAASLFAGTILYAMGRHRSYLTCTISGALAGTLLYLILIPTMGLKGAALALVLSEFVVAAAGFASLPQGLRILWKSPIILVALAAALLMVVAVRSIGASVPKVSVVIPAGVLIYAVSCGWFVRNWLVDQFGNLSDAPGT